MKVVTVSRKPCVGATTSNVLQYQAGAINIDACRISYTSEADKTPSVGKGAFQREEGIGSEFPHHKKGWGVWHVKHNGRWPANTILQHRPGCCQTGTIVLPGYTINRWTDGAKPFGDGAGHPYTSETQGDEQVPVWACESNCPVLDLGARRGPSYSAKASRGRINTLGSGVRSSGTECQTTSRFFKQVRKMEREIFPQEELWDYLLTLISPPPACNPLLIVEESLEGVAWESYAEGSVHGILTSGNPEKYLEQIHRVLRPGAHLLVVASDEEPTGYEAACALEDFGYEIRDAIAIVDEPGEYHYFTKASSKERHAGVTPRERVTETTRLFPKPNIDRDVLIAEIEDTVKAKHLAKIDEEGLAPEEVPEDSLESFEERVVTDRRILRNSHPTVKSIGIMVCLLEDIPKEAVVLDSFMGSGTTGLACLRTGHNFMGIEQEVEYLQITDERVRHWDRATASWQASTITSEAPPLEEEAQPEGGVFDLFGSTSK